jgi:hypothetical protein
MMDLGLGTLKKLAAEGDREAFQKVAEEMLAHHPDHLGILVEEIAFAYKHDTGDDASRDALLEKIDAVIARIDTSALALYFTVNHREEKGGERAEKEDTRRALHRLQSIKAALLLDMDRRPAFQDAFEEAFRWKPPDQDDDPIFHELTRTLYREKDRLGLLLEDAAEGIEDAPGSRTAYMEKIDILKKLGLDFWVAYEEKRLLRRIPPVRMVY